VTYVLRYQPRAATLSKSQARYEKYLKQFLDMWPAHIPWYNWNTINEATVAYELEDSVFEIPVTDTQNTFHKVDIVAVNQ
jgi:hypothetical protein